VPITRRRGVGTPREGDDAVSVGCGERLVGWCWVPPEVVVGDPAQASSSGKTGAAATAFDSLIAVDTLIALPLAAAEAVATATPALRATSVRVRPRIWTALTNSGLKRKRVLMVRALASGVPRRLPACMSIVTDGADAPSLVAPTPRARDRCQYRRVLGVRNVDAPSESGACPFPTSCRWVAGVPRGSATRAQRRRRHGESHSADRGSPPRRWWHLV
jgi:hypothetical protein